MMNILEVFSKRKGESCFSNTTLSCKNIEPF
jgi:hypothetical protein